MSYLEGQERKDGKYSAQERFLKLSCEQLEEKRDHHKDRGEYEECIMAMERIIIIKKQSFGEESEELIRGVNELSQLLNMVGMIQLEKRNLDFSLQVLKKAEMLMNASPQMKAVTLNNMACYYRHTGKIRTALNYLQNALEIESQLDEKDITLGDTHLNISVVLSQLGRHQLALEHAMMALVCLQDELLAVSMESIKIQQGQQQQENDNKRILENKKNIAQNEKKGNVTKTTAQLIRKERIAMLCIAFHNLGVEFEHLKREKEALKLYKKAHQMAMDYLGGSHAVVKKLERVLQNISSQQAEKEVSLKRQMNVKIGNNKNGIEKEDDKRAVLNRIFPSQSAQVQKNQNHQLQQQFLVSGNVNIKENKNLQDNKTKEQLRLLGNNNIPSQNLKKNKENQPPRSSASTSISAVSTPRQSCQSLLPGSARANRRYAPSSRSFSIDSQAILDHSINSSLENKLADINSRQQVFSSYSEFQPDLLRHPLSARSNPLRQPISTRFSKSKESSTAISRNSQENIELLKGSHLVELPYSNNRTTSSLSNIFVPQELHQNSLVSISTKIF